MGLLYDKSFSVDCRNVLPWVGYRCSCCVFVVACLTIASVASIQESRTKVERKAKQHRDGEKSFAKRREQQPTVSLCRKGGNGGRKIS